MRRPVALSIVLRTSLIVAVVACSALVIEYQNVGDPAFCGAGSGCFQVRISPQSTAIREMLGVSLPQLGLAAHVGLLAASLVAKLRVHHLMLAGLAAIGAVFASYLIYAQGAEIGAYCAWCVATDTSAIVTAATAIAIAVDAWKNEREAAWAKLSGFTRPALAWAGAGLLAIALPFVWAAFPVVPPAPSDVTALAQPGKVVYVQFTDFECPFCRKLHPVVEALRKEKGADLVYHRKMKPLSGHPGALPAALAYLCVPDDKRDAMADALYGAPSGDLTPKGVAAIAGGLGVDLDAFASCVASEKTKALLDQDSAMYDRLGPKGLPLSFVNQRVIVGFDEAKIRRAVAVEIAGGRLGLPVWTMFVAMGAVAAAAAFVTWRRAAA